MMVLHLASCPPALRGDLTKWLIEIAVGVYVGRVSARVRDKLWSRVVETCKGGRSVLVYNTNNEQRLEFRVHGESWEPIDFDGMKLMMRPSSTRIAKKKNEIINSKKSTGFSAASKIRIAKRNMGRKTSYPSDYVVIDVETTGLNPSKDVIIEIGAIKVVNNVITEEYQSLVLVDVDIPAEITDLTGIDRKLLTKEGKTLKDAINGFVSFCEKFPFIAHNMDFDKSFLNYAMKNCNLPPINNRTIDTLAMAKRSCKGLGSYKLSDLAEYFELAANTSLLTEYSIHRGLGDCHKTHELYQKLLNFDVTQ